MNLPQPINKQRVTSMSKAMDNTQTPKWRPNRVVELPECSKITKKKKIVNNLLCNH